MKTIFTFLLAAIALSAYAQNKTFSIGTASPNTNAALHVESPTNNQGFLMPRLTTAQRVAMVLTPTDLGLSVYDSDLKGIYAWDGTGWRNGGFVLPLVTTVSANSNAFDITNTGTGNSGYFKVANTASLGNAVFATSNTSNDRPAIYGEHTGTGSGGGAFKVTNAANGFAGVYGETVGTGSAGYFKVINAANNFAAVTGETNGSGSAVFGNQTGTGRAGQFQILNAANANYAVRGYTNGTASAAQFNIDNATNASAALASVTNGLGRAGIFTITNASNSTPSLEAGTIGTGPAVKGESTGAGQAGFFNVDFATHVQPGLQSNTNGLGSAGSFFANNASSVSDAIYAQHIGGGPAMRGVALGTGTAGTFAVNNAANTGAALNALTNGTGTAIYGSTSTGYTAIHGKKEGANFGSAGIFEITDADNEAQALVARSDGMGSAGNFSTSRADNPNPALVATSNGIANAITGIQTSTGSSSGFFEISHASNSFNALQAKTVGTGAAGGFEIMNASSAYAAIIATTNGTGPVVHFLHNGASGDIAGFASANVMVARIDKTGKGFFNGGTQASGADVAEMFDVEGARQDYEAGDVLVISELTDRTIERSSEANSTKVVGVYATKPGVTLSEKGIEENMDQMVPLGVIGVIPTKVCSENGPIKRGDLLVTSSKKGYAMKAVSPRGDGMFPAGTILGKALENLEGNEAVIKVLVNVK